MRSETLIPLDRVHPPSRDTRERDHQTISDQVADYLAGGGQIKFVDRAESATAGEPIIRNRRDQVAWRKMNNLIKKV